MAAITGLLTWQALGQSPTTPDTTVGHKPEAEQSISGLSRFDLDFPGGTPVQLVEAIGRAMGKSLNAIVPPDASDVRLPHFKLRSVTLPELFEALENASRRIVTYQVGSTWQNANTAYGFRKAPGGKQGTDDSVYSFFYEKPLLQPEQKVCRFWQLAPFLESYQIDDITTAIQTGYRLLGETEPTISFHKDTKLLIAVGDANKLRLIDNALDQLWPRSKAVKKENSTSDKSPDPKKQ